MKASDTFRNKMVTSCCSQIVLKQQTNSEINVIGAKRLLYELKCFSFLINQSDLHGQTSLVCNRLEKMYYSTLQVTQTK